MLFFISDIFFQSGKSQNALGLGYPYLVDTSSLNQGMNYTSTSIS